MFKLLLKKELSKDLLQVIGYYVFVAGFVRLGYPIVQQEHWVAKVFVGLFTLWLIWFVFIFSLLHVIRPIVKLYHPNFTLPEIDEGHERPKNWVRATVRRDYFLMLLIFLATTYIGWFIVGAALKTVTVSA